MWIYRFIGQLPEALLYRLGWCLYQFIYRVVGYRRAVVRDNLRHAFPDKTVTELTVIEKSFYRGLCELLVEILRAPHMTAKQFAQRVMIENPELLKQRSENYRQSVILLTIHQGNWEWMLKGVALSSGMPMVPIYKHLHSSSADRFIKLVRSQFGATPVSISEAPRYILKHRNTAQVIAMVADQAPIRKERSYWANFLNRDAAFYLGAETLARATGFPVLFAMCKRNGRGEYSICYHDISNPPHSETEFAITDGYIALAERAIKEQPEAWLWSNRRWKRRRPAPNKQPV